MAGVDPHPPRPPQEDVEKPAQSIPQTQNSNLQTKPSNIEPNQPIAKLSYSDILKGGNPQFLAASSNSTGLNYCQGMDFDSVDLKPRTWYQGKPAVSFSVSEKKSLVEKLKFVLIGKFSHGRPALIKIKELFTALKLHRPCNITVFDKKHIFIECACKIDYDRIWLKLNWFIDGFVMRIIKWTPEFIPIKESPIVPVWIRIEGLPLYLFDEVSLLSIANTIGKPIRVDPRNVTHTIVNYARICVELDVSQPLLHDLWVSFEDDKSKTMIEGFWAKVFYDVLPSFCHFCSHIGHDVSSCKRRVEESSRHKGVVVTSVVECSTSRDPALSAPGNGSASQDHATKAPWTAAGVAPTGELSSVMQIPIDVQESSTNAQTGGLASRAATRAVAGCVGTARAVQTSIAKKTAAGYTTAGAKKSATFYTSENTTTGAEGDPIVHSEPDRMGLETMNSMVGQTNAEQTSIAGQNMLAGHTKTVQNAHVTAELLTTGNSFAALNEVVLIEDLTLEQGELAVEDIGAAAADGFTPKPAAAGKYAAGDGEHVVGESDAGGSVAGDQAAETFQELCATALESSTTADLLVAVKDDAAAGWNSAAGDDSDGLVKGMKQLNGEQENHTDAAGGDSAAPEPAVCVRKEAADSEQGTHSGAALVDKQDQQHVEEEVLVEDITLEEGELVEQHVNVTDRLDSGGVRSKNEGVLEQAGSITQSWADLAKEEQVQHLTTYAIEEIEMIMATPTSTFSIFEETVPNTCNASILDLEGSPVPCSEIIRNSARIADVRKHFQFLNNEKFVETLVEQGKYEEVIKEAMIKYTKEIRRTFLDHAKSIYPKDSTTEKDTSQTQEATPKVSTVDEKEWSTPKRRGKNRNRSK